MSTWNPMREQDRLLMPTFRQAEYVDGGSVKSPSGGVLDSFGAMTLSGVQIFPGNATRISTVYACRKVISEDIAKLPLKLFRYLFDAQGNAKGKLPDHAHPLYNILYILPNRWQTAFEFRNMMQGHLLLRGNAYAWIRRDGRGTVQELVPQHPDRVTLWISDDDGSLFYEFRQRGGQLLTGKRIPQRDVFHLRGLSTNGYVGVSPIDEARESLGLAYAAEQHDASLLGKGATFGGGIKVPGKLTTESKNDMRLAFQSLQGGALNAGRTPIFENGAEWVNLSMTPAQLQLLETRQFQIPEIARIFRMQLHKIQELTRATFSNIEQQAREYVDDTLYPWFVCWEQAIVRDLLLPEERALYFARFNPNALLRADTLSRVRANVIECGGPYVLRNEVRDREDMNTLDDPAMDEMITPLNVAVAADPLAAGLDQKAPN